MLTDRAFPFRYGVQAFAWAGLAILLVLVRWSALPGARQATVLLFILLIVVYLAVLFNLLLPRTRYAPRVIYASLVVDVLVIGLLVYLLADVLPNLWIAFLPIIAFGALVADWRGVIALALGAAAVNMAARMPFLLVPDAAPSLAALVGQLQVAASFALVGLTVLLLVEAIRRRALASSTAALQAAEGEREQREQAERAARRWELITAVGLRVQEEFEPQAIFEVVGNELRALKLECLVGLTEGPNKDLRLAYLSLAPTLVSYLEHVLGVSTSDLRLSIQDQPELRKAIAERQPLYFQATAEAIRHILPNVTPSLAAQVAGLAGVGKDIVVPLFSREETLGILSVWGRDLEPSDVRVMTGLAQHLAVSLEKARLLEREQKRAAQLALVSEIAERAVGMLDLDELLSEVTRLVVERFGFESASVLLNQPGKRMVVLRAHAGRGIAPHTIGYTQSWDLGLMGHAARTGQTVVSNDVRIDARYYPANLADDYCRAELCVPLKRGEETLGVMDVQSSKLNAFEPPDVAAMEALAGQIAAAIEKGELFAAERKRAAQLALVSAIAERVASILDPDQLLQHVTELIRERFGYYNVAILMLDESAHEVFLRALAGAYAEIFPPSFRQKVSVGLIGAAARTGTTVVANDVSQDPRFYFPSEHVTRTASEISVPLKIGSRTLGVLDIQATVTNAFDASDVAAMETLANQIAIALDKARLYRDAQRRLEEATTLYRFGLALSETLEASELGRRALSVVESLLHFRYAEVLLANSHTRDLTPLAVSTRAQGEDSRGLDDSGHTPGARADQGITGWVARTGRPLRVGVVAQDPRYFALREDTRSELCVPLQVGERVIGVLNLESARLNAFTEDDERLLTTLAATLAVSIENARLYAQTKDEAEVKTALLRELSHRVKNNLTAIAGLLYLRLEDEQTPRQEILSETLARVQSMAVAHTLLADSPRARVDLLDLSRRVVGDSVRQLTLPGRPISFNVQGKSIEISAHQASSLALVLNELVTNAIKHGGDTGASHFALSIDEVGSEARVEIFNSRSVPVDFDLDPDSSGLGLQLIRTLVEKDLDGSFTIGPDAEGVRSVIRFVPERA